MEREEVELFEGKNYDQWTPSEVAAYIVKHSPPQKEENIQKIYDTFQQNGIDGKRLQQIAITNDADGVWKKEITRLPLELPPAELQRGAFHPSIVTLIDVPKKLLDSGNGLWKTLHMLYKRTEKYDAVYDESEGYWCHDRGGRPYFNPGSWRRYGFFPEVEGENPEKVEEIMKKWHVAYHGTKFLNVDSIVKFGLVPPDTVVNGQVIKNARGKAGAIGNKIPIYVTPSIAYAAHYLYTSPIQDKDEYIYCVFQVRIRPGSFRQQGNTLWHEGWGDKSVIFDDRFGPDELEWLVDDANDVRVTGLMVQRDKLEPKEKIKQLFLRNKARAAERRGEGVGKWYWNSAPANGRTLDRNGPWGEYRDFENRKIEKAFQNYQAVCWLGDVETDKGEKMTYFVDFTKMEQLRCDDNKLRRAIKREVLPA